MSEPIARNVVVGSDNIKVDFNTQTQAFDIVARNPNNNRSVDVSNGSGFTRQSWGGAFPGSVTWQDWTTGDFNGGGQEDLGARNPGNNNFSSSVSWADWSSTDTTPLQAHIDLSARDFLKNDSSTVDGFADELEPSTVVLGRL